MHTKIWSGDKADDPGIQLIAKVAEINNNELGIFRLVDLPV